MGWNLNGKHSDKTQRVPQPKAGVHRVRIYELVTADLSRSSNGDCPKFSARIVESTSEPIGKEVGKVWFVNDSRDKYGYTLGEVLAFGRALVGSAAFMGKNPADADAVRGVLRQVFNPDREDTYRPYEKGQPLRGLDIRIESKANGEYVDLTFAPIPQTKEQLKSQREEIEAWVAGKLPGAATAPEAATLAAAAEPPPAAPAPAAGILDGMF